MSTGKVIGETRREAWSPHTNADRWIAGLGSFTAAGGAVAAGVGLAASGKAAASHVTTERGDLVQLYGEGLYRYDSLFMGAGNRGTDLVTLVAGVPLMLVCLWAASHGSPRARLLLPGAFAWFLYVYATLSVTAAYNQMYLMYVALFAASLYGGALAVRAADIQHVTRRAPSLPRRLPGYLLLVSGVVTPLIWLGPVVSGQLAGDLPDRLDHYTTFVTYALDTAIIAPAAVIAGLLVLHARGAGYVMAVPLLVIESALAPVICAQTAFQLNAGVHLSPAEVAGPVSGFVLLSTVALTALVKTVKAMDATNGVRA